MEDGDQIGIVGAVIGERLADMAEVNAPRAQPFAFGGADVFVENQHVGVQLRGDGSP